jgi:hypothetical protein
MIAYNQDEAIMDRILMMSSKRSSPLVKKRSKSENGSDLKDDSCIRDINLGGGELDLQLSNDDSNENENSDEESESAQERSDEQSANVDKSSSADVDENDVKFNLKFDAKSGP